MKKVLVGVLLVTFSNISLAKIESYRTIDNENGTVTVHPYRSTSWKDGCGYDLNASIRIGGKKHKNKVCRRLGYKSYVPGTLVIDYEATRYFGTFIESISACVGAPVGTSKGIKSIDCYID